MYFQKEAIRLCTARMQNLPITISKTLFGFGPGLGQGQGGRGEVAPLTHLQLGQEQSTTELPRELKRISLISYLHQRLKLKM